LESRTRMRRRVGSASAPKMAPISLLLLTNWLIIYLGAFAVKTHKRAGRLASGHTAICWILVTLVPPGTFLIKRAADSKQLLYRRTPQLLRHAAVSFELLSGDNYQ
jgi:hypothetical protein